MNSTKKTYDITNILFLTITPPLALILVTIHLMTEGFLWQQWLLGLGFYFLMGLSITAGYHRLFSHRAYKAHPIIEALFLFFGAGAFQNSLLKWGSDHRRHHTKCDGPEDPYSISKGFFYAHMGWIFEAETEDLTDRFGKELKRNPRVMFQHKHYLVLAVVSGMILPTFVGWMLGSWLGGLAISGIFRIVFVHHATFFINSLCHVWGTQPYGDDNSAKDSRLMAIFTYGEGHHNYHHHFQADYRNGIKWFDFDPTKWLINSLSYLGLATDLIQTDEEDILAAKLQMQHKLALKNIDNPSIASQVEARFMELKAELKKLKKKRQELMALKGMAAREMVQELKRQLKLEQSLFEQKCSEWREFLSGTGSTIPS